MRISNCEPQSWHWSTQNLVSSPPALIVVILLLTTTMKYQSVFDVFPASIDLSFKDPLVVHGKHFIVLARDMR